MARLSSLALVLLFITLSSFVSNISQARKFLVVNNNSDNNYNKKDTMNTRDINIVASRPLGSEGSLFLSALPKGKVPSSAPSKKGHADIVNEKLIARHLIALDRSLRSVPSPGVGH